MDKYYQQLFEQVQEVLQRGEIPEGAHKVIQVHRSATWGQPTAWTVYYPALPDGKPNRQAPHCRRVMWRSAEDIRRINKVTQPMQPTILQDDLALPPDAFGVLMESGQRIRVPLFGVRLVSGIDGTHYRVVIPPLEHSPIKSEIQLEWWEHGAEEWKPFTGWVVKMIELFESVR